MKKQTAMFLSVSAVLALGVVAPKVWWNNNDASSSRAPASEEAKQEELKPLEKVEVKSRPVKEIDLTVQASCLKDTQPENLKAEIEKLMKDKEAVLKELADLKKDKKEDKKPEDKKEDKKKVAKAEDSQDLVVFMMQMTQMMMSQQQQQMTMMNNMFSMFQMQQPMQSKYQGFSPMSDYMSPYAFNASDFVYPKTSYDMMFPMNMGSQIGLSYDYNRAYPSFDRQPAQQMDANIQGFDRSLISQEASSSFQPQQLEKRPHNGFDFR